jgi:hypothetical protein
MKGTMLLGLVKAIRADEAGAYDALLSAEDLEFVPRQILPSSWYAFETYKRLFTTVTGNVTKGDMELVRRLGRDYGGDIVTNVYKCLVVVGKPVEALRKHTTVFKSFFDFGEIEFETLSDSSARVRVRRFDADFESYY